jgi:O-antigen/teichoic acid export membrane protein
LSTIKRLAKNTGVLFVAQILSYILGFLYLMYTARYLGPAAYGILSFAMAFTVIFGIMADLGLSQFVVREVSRNKSLASKYLGNALVLKIIASLFTFILVVIAINLLDYPKNTINVVYLIALYVLINSFSQIFCAIFQSYEKMEYMAIGTVLNGFLLITLAFIGIKYKMDVTFFASVYLMSSILIFSYYLIICTLKFVRPKLKFNFNFWKIMLSESLFFVLAMGFTEIYFNIDSVMLSLMVGNEAVGFYNAAYKLIFILLFIPSTVIVSIFPLMSQHHESAKNLLKEEFEKLFRYLIILALFLFVFGFLFADKMILMIYGNAFIPSIMALQILICVIPIIFITYLFGNLLGAINKQRVVAVITGICAIINITFNLFLIPKFSYYGASVATVLTEIVVFIFYFIYISRFFHKISIKENIIKPILVALILAIVIFIILYINWILAFITGLVIYVPLLYLMKVIGKEDVELIKKIWEKDKID